MIKNVVDTCLRWGRQLEGDHVPLHQLFVILDLALRHGLRTGRRGVMLLGARREVWDLVQVVEARDPGAQDITDTVRQLTTVNTPAGRSAMLTTLNRNISNVMLSFLFKYRIIVLQSPRLAAAGGDAEEAG